MNTEAALKQKADQKRVYGDTKRLQELIHRAETLPDPNARGLMTECLRLVLELYGEGLQRVVNILQSSGPGCEDTYRSVLNDPLLRGLLLIHGLHPESLETRLRESLQKVRPYMESHGGNVDIVSLVDDVATLRFQGACDGCPSSAVTMELAIRRAVEEACPDLLGLEVEGITDKPENGYKHYPAHQRAEFAFDVLPAEHQLNENELRRSQVGGVDVVLCKANEQLYAYRDLCPSCGMPLSSGKLNGSNLECSLGHRFDVRHAGNSLDGSGTHLDPFPLIVEEGKVQISVG